MDETDAWRKFAVVLFELLKQQAAMLSAVMVDVAAIREAAFSKDPELLVRYQESLAKQVNQATETIAAVAAQCDVQIEQLTGPHWKN